MKKPLRILITGKPEVLLHRLPQKSAEGLVMEWHCLPVLSHALLSPPSHWFESTCQSQWVVISSPTAARFFDALLKKENKSIPSSVKWAAMGRQTQSVLEGLGYKVSFFPQASGGDEFLKEFLIYQKNEGENFPALCFPRSSRGLEIVEKGLAALGYPTFHFDLYTTTENPSWKKSLPKDWTSQFSSIVFTSPSSAQFFIEKETIPSHIQILSLGQSTQSFLEQHQYPSTKIPMSQIEGLEQLLGSKT